MVYILEYLVQYLTWWNMLALLVTLVIGLFTTLSIYIYTVHRKYDHIPGPPREGFYLGNGKEIRRHRAETKGFFQELMLKWTKQYGYTYKVMVFHITFVITSDPEAVKDLMVTGHHPKSKELNKPLENLWGERFLGYGLVTETDHKKWAFRRAMMNPCFMKSYLRNLTADFNTCADVLITKLANMADGNTKICLLDMFHKVTLDVIGKVAFGLEINSLETDNSEFTRSIFMAFKGLSVKTSSTPLFALNPFNWKFIRDVRKSLQFLRSFGKKILQERTEAIQRGDYVPDDILTHMIKAKEENIEMDTEVILDDFVTFFVAGQETTASLLGSVVELICRNPKTLIRLREEIDENIGEKSIIETKDLDSLVYLDMVIKETLRLASPASMTSRKIVKDNYVIGGYKIPKGTNVLMSTYVGGRLPDFFENPEEFDPERFSPYAEKRYNTYAYFPFAMGPRTCIGKHFADMEAKIIMAKLIQRFDIELDTSKPFELEEISTIRPRGGATCVLTLRDNK